MEPTTRVELAELVAQSLERIEAQYPSVTIESASVPDDVYVDGTLDVVLLNVLENAAMHNDALDPQVRIEVENQDESVRIEIADNGPGIDDYERAVIERGMEDSLQHSSGLGLWLIKWGAEIAGGEIELRDNEPTGTVVTVHVPRLSAPGVESDTVRTNSE
jgi:K+-sensing histidine kinase KdpD